MKTELEIIAHAQSYLEKLANGIDPLTGTEVGEGDIVRQARIAKCLEYSARVLGQVVAAGGIQRKGYKPFFLTMEQMARFRPAEGPLAVVQIAKRIDNLCEDMACKSFAAKRITDYLLYQGYMEEVVTADGQKHRRPTQKGRDIGIYEEERTGSKGPYISVVYSVEAQQFIGEHLPELLLLTAPKK